MMFIRYLLRCGLNGAGPAIDSRVRPQNERRTACISVNGFRYDNSGAYAPTANPNESPP